MPDFSIEGDPAAIRGRAVDTRSTGQAFIDVADALDRITTDGWTGRAADAFRDASGSEPDRWRDAGRGFLAAASAYEVYADAIVHARSRAGWASSEYRRGDEVTRSARAAWEHEQQRRDAELVSSLGWAPVTSAITHPFVDPGEQIRDAAVAEYERAVAELDAAAHTCAAAVRAACAGAPASRNWFESGVAFVGGILEGAGEAVWDLLTITPLSAGSIIRDVWKMSTGELTPEELAAQWQLALEVPGQMLDALRADPVAFGRELGKGLLDWDTWGDDPARAIGHLVPDAIAAVLTAGTGAVATRGARAGVDLLDTAGDLASTANRLEDIGDLGSGANRLDDLPFTSRMYDLADGSLHSTRFAPDQIDVTRTAQHVIDEMLADPDLFARHGLEPWTRDDLVDIVTGRSVHDLSPGELGALREIADSLPPPGVGDGVQKVLTPAQAQAMLDPANQGTPAATTLGGSITRIEDTAHLDDVASLQDGLRLDYDDQTFLPHHVSEHVVRFELEDDVAEISRFSEMGGRGDTDAWTDPYTGNGFLKSDELIPEYRITGDPRPAIPDGAEMWEVLADGTQRLAAVFRGGQWVPVG